MPQQRPEKLNLKLKGLGEYNILFDSGFLKILTIIILGILIFGYLSFLLIKFLLLAGVIFSFLLLGVFLWILKKTFDLADKWPWLFVSAQLVRPVMKFLIGNENRESRNITDLPIEKQTVVRKISARAKIVEVKKVNQLGVGEKGAKP